MLIRHRVGEEARKISSTRNSRYLEIARLSARQQRPLGDRRKVLLAGLLGLMSEAMAEDSSPPRTSILDSDRGPKQYLQDAGIDLSVNYTGFYQGLVGGEGEHGGAYGGKTDLIVRLVGEKLDLWQGLYVTVHASVVSLALGS
jgi:hypothetical protein